jgi:DNA-binding IclR family transcriptional regulator
MSTLPNDGHRLLRTLAGCGDGATFADLSYPMSLADRKLDRMLQRMRRAGLIVYERRDGDTRKRWHLTAAGKRAAKEALTC